MICNHWWLIEACGLITELRVLNCTLRHVDDYSRICGVCHAHVVNAWIGHHGVYKTAAVGVLIAAERNN